MSKTLVCALFLGPLVALEQVFYTEEGFYRHLEHKACLEAIQWLLRENRR